MKIPELLAPAKDFETGVTAINCGADAIYIGGPRFGARAASGNSICDISKIVSYAHRYWAKVYVTVNTLLFENELSEAVAMIYKIYEAGVDGIIIQDMGLLECDLPPISLIASTQVYANSLEKVLFFEKIGFKRVILPRELALDEIRCIRNGTSSIELESFVHGALCVSYSGQCFLSYALGGRSGNRGVCAQPCRKKYILLDSKGKSLGDKYWLSLKDLNRSGYLRDLLKAGVSSFKIEGRLKGKEYVMNVVSFYRKRLDQILEERGENPKEKEYFGITFNPNLDKTFNRRYTSFWGRGTERKAGSNDTPKMMGEFLGTISEKRAGYVVLDTSDEVHPGDGICFFNKHGDLCGTRVERVLGKRISLQNSKGINEGTRLFRNLDYEWVQKVLKGKSERKIIIRMHIRMNKTRFLLNIRDFFGNEVSVFEDGEFGFSNNPVTIRETIKQSLGKTGNSEFLCREVLFEGEDVFFIPISKLNNLRRRGILELREIREKRRQKSECGIKKNSFPYPQKLIGFDGNILNSFAEAFYKRHGVEKLVLGAELGLSMKGKKVMRCRYCVLPETGNCLKTKKKKDFKEPLYLLDEKGNRFRLVFDCQNCEMEVIYS